MLAVLDRPRGFAADRLRQAGAEQRIDNERTRLRIEFGQRLCSDRAFRSRQRRVAASPRRVVGENRDRDAALMQQPRDDITVAAIVAGTAQHMHAGRRRIALEHDCRDRSPGAPHQCHAVERPGFDRQPVGFSHFPWCQKFMRHRKRGPILPQR